MTVKKNADHRSALICVEVRVMLIQSRDHEFQ